MKKLFFALIILALTWPYSFAQEKPSSGLLSKCPVSQMTDYKDSCLTCHAVRNGIFTLREEKERDPHWLYNYSPNTKLLYGVGYYTLKDVNSDELVEFFEYIDRHEISHAIIEIFSPGGSVFEAWRIVGIIEEKKSQGYIVETRNYGAAFSAGFLIFASGTKGHRLISSTAECM